MSEILLQQSVISKIMDRAMILNKETPTTCRDFQIMVSSMRPNSLILRWTCIDLTDFEKPMQCYRYECFDVDGISQKCSIHYSNQEEANDFLWSLEPLYHQKFAIDHTL